jgi:hypothetical protein
MVLMIRRRLMFICQASPLVVLGASRAAPKPATSHQQFVASRQLE